MIFSSFSLKKRHLMLRNMDIFVDLYILHANLIIKKNSTWSSPTTQVPWRPDGAGRCLWGTIRHPIFFGQINTPITGHTREEPTQFTLTLWHYNNTVLLCTASVLLHSSAKCIPEPRLPRPWGHRPAESLQPTSACHPPACSPARLLVYIKYIKIYIQYIKWLIC